MAFSIFEKKISFTMNLKNVFINFQINLFANSGRTLTSSFISSTIQFDCSAYTFDTDLNFKS